MKDYDLARLFERHPLPWSQNGDTILDARSEVVTIFRCTTDGGAELLAEFFVRMMPVSSDAPRPRQDS
jgi:hypothetical protein